LGERHSSISQQKIFKSYGSNLLSRIDDRSFSLPTVELQPVFSLQVFNVRKADADIIKELVEVNRLCAVIELFVIGKGVIF
jgi:hypothetical protein